MKSSIHPQSTLVANQCHAFDCDRERLTPISHGNSSVALWRSRNIRQRGTAFRVQVAAALVGRQVAGDARSDQPEELQRGKGVNLRRVVVTGCGQLAPVRRPRDAQYSVLMAAQGEQLAARARLP